MSAMPPFLKVRNLWRDVDATTPLGVELDAQCWSEDRKHLIALCAVVTGSLESGKVVWRDRSGGQMFPTRWMLHGDAEARCSESDPEGVQAIADERQ